MVKKVSLISEFGSNIFTRNSISNFFSELNLMKDKEIVLDFESVEFISRSCADEYLKQKKVSKKKIIEANMSNEICSMFKNVENQYEKAGVVVSFPICEDRCKNVVSV